MHIAENEPIGTELGQVTAVDETGKPVVYTIVSRDGASVFAVDTNGECEWAKAPL